MFSYFSRFLHRIWLFFPKLSKFFPIQLDSKGNIFCKAMKYYGANLCVKSSTNINTNSIFQFLTIFVQNLTILPQIEKS